MIDNSDEKAENRHEDNTKIGPMLLLSYGLRTIK